MDAHLIVVTSLLLLLVASVRSQCPVLCSNSSGIAIRLSAVPGLHSDDGNVGRLEVCCDNQWGTVGLEEEHHFWSEKNVQVACGQLGFSGGLNSILPVNVPATLPPRQVLLYKVACTGSESEVSQCKKGAPTSELPEVYIVCRPRNRDYSSVHKPGPQSGDIRLFGSIKNGEGAVEMFTGSHWATLCPDSSWGNSNARTLCTTLGYDGGIAKILNNTEGPRHMARLSDAQCSDPVTTPTNPVSNQVLTKYCSFISGSCQADSDLLAGIQCSSNSNSKTQSFRLFGVDLFDDTDISGVLEVFEDSRWGMVCSNSSKEEGKLLARIICRSLQLKDFPNAKIISIPPDKLTMYESSMKPIWLDGITCPEDALSITDCVFGEPLGFGDCFHGDILAVRCDVHGNGGGNPLIIVGAVILAVVAVVAIFIFLVYLRRVFTRRDRVSVTSVAITETTVSENRNGRRGDASMNFLLVQESQLNDMKQEETSGEDVIVHGYGSVNRNHHSNV